MADGSIVFSTSLDNSDLEKQIRETEKKIDSLKRKIEDKTTERNAIAEQMEDAEKVIERTKERLEQLKARYDELKQSSDPTDAARREIVSKEIEKQYELLGKQEEASGELAAKWLRLDEEIDGYNERLETAQQEYIALGNEAQKQAAKSNSAFSRASNSIRTRLATTAANVKASFLSIPNSIGNAMQALSNRVTAAFKRMFLFGMILAGIAAIKTAITDIVSNNKQFQASVTNLRAVMRGFLSTMVSAILPTIMNVVNVLAAVFERIASFIDSFFGTNIIGAIQEQRAALNASNADTSNSAANAEDKQAKAAKKLAKEQEKANRQLMAFDELNVLNAESSNDAVDSGGYGDVADGGWMANFNPDLGLFSGVLDWLDELRRRIETDVEGPFARIREGLQLIKQGWDELVTGIQTGNWQLVWIGVGDIVIGALYVIEGAFTAFLDWLDEMTGGRFTKVFEGIKKIVHGAVEVIEGLLRGDLQLALQGLFDIADGISETISGLVDSSIQYLFDLIDGFVKLSKSKWEEFINELIRKYPELKGFLEGVKVFVFAILDLISGGIKGLVSGAGTIVKGAINGLMQLFKGLFEFIAGLFTGNKDMIANGLKVMLNGAITVFEAVINGLIEGAIGFLNGVINAANNLPGVSISTVSTPTVSIPRLAHGAVIPPNREFMAVLGDQRFGNNIEAPESLMRQIVREESGGSEQVEYLLGQMVELLRNGNAIYVDGQLLGRTAYREIASLQRMGGA